jgi:hypothetical protein
MPRVQAAIAFVAGAGALAVLGACAGLVSLPDYSLEADASSTTGEADDDGGPIMSEDGAVGCRAGQKICESKCVSTSDPAYGCAATSCDPCIVALGGTPECLSGVCRTRCAKGSLACDGGCVPQGPQNCGTCGGRCEVDAGEVCNANVCTRACDATNCYGSCVDLQTDPSNCGACGKSCARPNATATCDRGVCTQPACLAGFQDCDGDMNNGCECASPKVCDRRTNQCAACTPVGSVCTSDVACCNGGVCGNIAAAKICCLPRGSLCGVGAQCCSGACYKGSCQ